ncbi:MAG: hypothetical protein LH614_15635 [Pyrinomonadaceae bacterium]|nr:hypothetical protein [Pyrinomonadaceae bacterium]
MANQKTKYDDLLKRIKNVEDRALQHYNHKKDGNARAIADAAALLEDVIDAMECPPGSHDDGSGGCAPD